MGPAEPCEAIVFDCDGTLVDTWDAQLASWQVAFGTVGASMTPDWYRQRTGLNAEDLVSAMEHRIRRNLQRDDVLAAQVEAYLQLVGRVRPNARVVAIAEANHGRVPLAVASNSTRRLVLPTLRAIRIAELFDVIITAEDVRQGKPAPDTFLLAAQRLNVTPSGCIAYEDTENGIAAAKEAGMRVVDVRGTLCRT